MSTQSTIRRNRSSRIDDWLDGGGIVLAASERAARSLAAGFHETRQAEGKLAWQTPAIFAWDSWVQAEWESRDLRGLLLLNTLQEKSVWAEAIGRSGRGRALLNAGALAAAAQRAYQLLCGYAPAALKNSARLGWQGDAAEFSQWMEFFEARCRREGLVSRSRLPLELAAKLEETVPDASQRPRLLLAGFDRLLKSQRALLDAWGTWQQDTVEEPDRTDGTDPSDRTDRITAQYFYEAADGAGEIRGCVAWLREQLAANPQARLMVVVTGLEARRGELERELMTVAAAPDDSTHSDDPVHIDFEFSLGMPLGQMSHARSALLLLQWLDGPLSESEVDWLISSGHSAVSAEEETALAEAMLRIRRRGRERPSWRLEDFLASEPFRETGPIGSPADADGLYPPGRLTGWAERLRAASQLLQAMPKRQIPLAWVEGARKLLGAAGWPGFRAISSIAFQVCDRWERVLEDCGSLGFDSRFDDRARGMTWSEFVATLTEAVGETVFAAESSNARVQITGPLESAGQVADGIWLLGADEESWPGRGQPHPLLPIALQRDAEMPHASPQGDWNLAQEAMQRLADSAEEVIFSYARQSADIETRPSRLALRMLGAPEPMPAAQLGEDGDQTERFADFSRIPFSLTELRGGAGMLTAQSNCPFQAFATSRLQADTWEPAQAGLNARQRGILLHSVLHRIWSGAARGGISSHAELLAVATLREFVATHVGSAMRDNFDQSRLSALPDRFPARYLELESERLTRLLTEWLAYERERVPFQVAETEVDTSVTVAGLSLRLRLDRIDTVPRTQSSGALVIDYKSSEVGPKVWAGERPENVQLPLYATFAIPQDGSQQGELEGLVIAQVRPGKHKFSGRLRDANTSLQTGLGKASGLVKDPLTDAQLEAWRIRIERLGEDFLAGRADVDPREPGKTCETCHLHSVCRIHENELLDVLAGEDEETSGVTGGDDA